MECSSSRLLVAKIYATNRSRTTYGRSSRWCQYRNRPENGRNHKPPSRTLMLTTTTLMLTHTTTTTYCRFQTSMAPCPLSPDPFLTPLPVLDSQYLIRHPVCVPSSPTTTFSVAIALGGLTQDLKSVLSDAPGFKDLPSLPNTSISPISLSSWLKLVIPGNNATPGDLLTQVTPTEPLVPPIRLSLSHPRTISTTSNLYAHSVIIPHPENDKR